MAFPPEIRSHHTIWVDLPGCRTVALRYASDGERLVCLGDDGLAGVADGARLFASVRGLASGPLERYFRVTVRELDAAEVPLGTVADLVGDSALGRTASEVEASLHTIRSDRRLVALEP